jgi:predicted unusual protein kinase regulating ubiquinone biosynthesis (AarF/ABC1/UbiB family)
MKALWHRTIVVLWKIVPIILSFIRDFRRFLFFGQGRSLNEDAHHARARHLTQTLGELGPTFIKLAQVLSARADVLPPTYITELSTLQDKVPPNPLRAILQIISEDLHASVESIFDTFEEQPLAAASLGQVHRATYRGQDVVVKVLRPGVPNLIRMDLAIIYGILRVLNMFMSENHIMRSLFIVMQEFQRVILEEIDFELEAHNVKVFQRNFATTPFVRIPKVYDAVSTKRVIVLEFLEGVKINQVETIEQMGLDIPLILQRLAQIYIHQVAVDGMLHADPHPGNILVDREGRIIILDFGMVIRIDESFKPHMIKFAVAVAHRDIDGMVNEMYELRIVEPGTNKAILRDLAELFLEAQEQGKLSARKVQQLTETVMEAFYEFPFTLPSELVYIGRAASLIEGIGFIHDPWFDAVEVGRPIVKEMAAGVLKDELQQDIPETLRQWGLRSYQTVLALQDTILKTDREQLRIRLHPSDLQTVTGMMLSLVRRLLGGMWVIAFAGATVVVYFREGNRAVLLAGLLFSGLATIMLLFLPIKKPDNSYQKSFRKHLKLVTTEEGELYRSFVINQMSPEEREKMEAKRRTAQPPKE